jgi:hypothetical protein
VWARAERSEHLSRHGLPASAAQPLLFVVKAPALLSDAQRRDAA